MKLLSSGGLALLAITWVGLSACGDDDESDANTGGSRASGGTNSGSGGRGGSSGGQTPTGGKGGAMQGGSGGTAPSTVTECEVLGELCHPVDDEDGPLHECHELGHVADPVVCHEEFPSCVSQCVEAIEAAEGEGGGGSGGADGGAGEPGTAGAPAEPSPYCASLGELCHRVDDEDGPLHECHELGHVNDPAVCEEEFESCAAQCLEAIEEQEAGEGGAGGSGGQGPDETGGAAPLGGGGAGGEPAVDAGMGGVVEIGGSPGVAGDGGASPVDGGDGGMLGLGGDPGIAGGS